MNTTSLMITFGCLVLVFIGTVIPGLLKNIYINWLAFRLAALKVKEFARRQRERKEMLERGEMHEWITMTVLGLEKMVCKKTGWCPSENGFYDVDKLVNVLKMQDMEKRFNVFFEQTKEKIYTRYNINEKDLNNIVEMIRDAEQVFLKMEDENESKKV